MSGRDAYVVEVVRTFAGQARIMGPVALDRILGALADIDREARARADEVYLEELSKPGDGDGIDSIAEMAHEVGVEHHRALTGLKQGMINLLAVGLYQAFEQQRTEYKDACARAGVTPVPIDEEDLGRWPKVAELRLVANVAKHAEGWSCDELRMVRPDLVGIALFGGMPIPVEVIAPMAGQDLYVQPDDIREYASALVELWETVSAAHR